MIVHHGFVPGTGQQPDVPPLWGLLRNLGGPWAPSKSSSFPVGTWPQDVCMCIGGHGCASRQSLGPPHVA